MDALLLVLKLLGLVCSAAFGVLGTVHEFRTKAGDLTKWGKVAIVGTIASALVALSAQLLENRAAERSSRDTALRALESTQRLEKIVGELNRAIQPIDSMSIFVASLGLPMNDARLSDYKQRCESGIARYLRAQPAARLVEAGISTPGMTRRGKEYIPLNVEISPSHSLFPQPTDRLARSVLDVGSVELAFYSNPIDPKQFEPFSHRGPGDPDLRVSNGHSVLPLLALTKTLDNGTFNLVGHVDFHKTFWTDRTGRVVTIPDLIGAQMFIAFGPLGVDETTNDDFLQLRRQFVLDSLNIKIGTRSRWMRSSAITRHVSATGRTFFEFKFSKDPSKLFLDE